MSKYYFRVPHGRYAGGQSEATEFADNDAARAEALKVWGDLARDIATDLASEPEWRMEVADGSGKVVIRIRTVVESSFPHAGETNLMKKSKPEKPETEINCPACGGTGFPKVTQPGQPSRKIFPAPCAKCRGKGRISLFAGE
jgi:hypothetical protein